MVVLTDIHSKLALHNKHALKTFSVRTIVPVGSALPRINYQRSRCVRVQNAPEGGFFGILNSAASPTGFTTTPESALHTQPQTHTPMETCHFNGALTKADFPKFVYFFRGASPYIAGHRGRTFVIVVPGNVGSLVYHVFPE